MTMRVAHAVSFGGFTGGAERVAFDLAQGLAARGHSNVLVPLQPGGPDSAAYHGGFDQVVEPGSDVVNRLHETDADVLLLHSAEPPEWLESARAELPVVALVHDVSLTCPRTHRYLPLSAKACDRVAPLACWRCIFLPGRGRTGKLGALPVFQNARHRRAVRSLPRTVVPSRYLEDLLLRHGWRARTVSVVTPGRFGLNPPYPTQPEPGTVLFVGALNRGKGPDLLLEALAKLDGWQRLDVVGAGGWRDHLEQMAQRLGFTSRVKFHGQLSAAAVSERYQKAQVVAFPSRAPESFGLVGLEAMAHGRPVVAYDLGGVREWLVPGKTGLLAPVADVDALASALGELLDRPERARALGEAGRREWEEKHGTDRFVKHMERLLAQVEVAP
jgi:glycosyltransferase involved in cell wall biosynthesis